METGPADTDSEQISRSLPGNEQENPEVVFAKSLSQKGGNSCQ